MFVCLTCPGWETRIVLNPSVHPLSESILCSSLFRPTQFGLAAPHSYKNISKLWCNVNIQEQIHGLRCSFSLLFVFQLQYQTLKTNAFPSSSCFSSLFVSALHQRCNIPLKISAPPHWSISSSYFWSSVLNIIHIILFRSSSPQDSLIRENLVNQEILFEQHLIAVGRRNPLLKGNDHQQNQARGRVASSEFNQSAPRGF